MRYMRTFARNSDCRRAVADWFGEPSSCSSWTSGSFAVFACGSERSQAEAVFAGTRGQKTTNAMPLAAGELLEFFECHSAPAHEQGIGLCCLRAFAKQSWRLFRFRRCAP